MRRNVYALLSIAVAPLACVATVPPAGRSDVDAGGDPGEDRRDAAGAQGEGEGVPGDDDEGGGAGDGRMGVVVIDVQDAFVAGAVNPDIDGVLDRTGRLFELAADRRLPFFLTFEASTTGDHRLADVLEPRVPAQAQQFVKTTFDATGLQAFADAVDASGLTRLVVAGSETDVCVLQTVLGLRRRGYTVILEDDAVFSSETNTSPALRRMTQAGVVLADLARVADFADGSAALPDAAVQTVAGVIPGEVAIVLNHLDDGAVSGASDPWKAEKLARLRELLLVSEWFGVPLYASNPDAAPANLPAALRGLLRTAISPASRLDDDGMTQIVVAGTDTGLDDLVGAQDAARTVFLLEDALIAAGSPADLRARLDARYDDGDVPLTYKSFYYEMTATVAFEDWPADWIERDAEYYDRTVAPEDLPPITP